jgi:hypothetical protein
MKPLFAEWLLNNGLKQKVLFTGLFVFFLFNSIKAQTNLVPNGSFEYIDSCNYPGETITASPPWNNLFQNGGADVFSPCNTNGATAPFSIYNYQVARSGTNYIDAATFLTLGSGFSIKEYANSPLKSTLKNGHTYCVTFYVVIGNYTKYAFR